MEVVDEENIIQSSSAGRQFTAEEKQRQEQGGQAWRVKKQTLLNWTD